MVNVATVREFRVDLVALMVFCGSLALDEMSCDGRLAGRDEVVVLARLLEMNGGLDSGNGIARRLNGGL